MGLEYFFRYLPARFVKLIKLLILQPENGELAQVIIRPWAGQGASDSYSPRRTSSAAANTGSTLLN